MNTQSSFRQALPYFPASLQLPLSRIPTEHAAQIQEIRLRIGRPMHAVMKGGTYTVIQDGTLAACSASGLTVTRPVMDALFQNLCRHSLHSVQNAVRQGFLTIAGGSRAGLCGTAVIQNHTLESVRAVSGINLRIASERTGCAEPLLNRIGGANACGGLLLAGPPSSGKTTILRDLARILGGQKRVCLIDERGELAASDAGIPQFAVGTQTDVFDGYPKAEGIAIAVRVMSPEYIICDEIGGASETDAILQALNTGVQFLASVHASTEDELYRRPQIAKLIQTAAFRTAVFLQSGHRCGEIASVIRIRRDKI